MLCGRNCLLLILLLFASAKLVNAQSLAFDGSGSILLDRGVMAITCGANTAEPSGVTFALADTRLTGYSSGMSAMSKYMHPDWNVNQIGNVDGIAIDQNGNMYVAATSTSTSFSRDGAAMWRYGNIGGGANSTAAAGTVYKIDATTGTPTVFAQLPQQSTTLFSAASSPSFTDLGPRSSGPGLGNIAYDEGNDQLFVVNMEDGRIYRLNSSGATAQIFDPLSPDDGAAGFPAESERVQAVAVYNDRVYYSLRGTSHGDIVIRSVGLNASGAFLPATDVSEINVNYSLPESSNYSRYNLEMAISDIAFSKDGHMALAGRTFIEQSPFDTYNHDAYNFIFEYTSGSWSRRAAYGTGTSTGGSVIGPGESYGGISWGPYQLSCDYTQLLWSFFSGYRWRSTRDCWNQQN